MKNRSMDVDLSKLPTGTTGWLALIDYTLQLGDLAEVDYLELKGRLTFESSSARKRAAVVLCRAVLGMANRMPDVAERHLGGAGVVLVGVDQSNGLVGVDEIDGATLRDSVQAYIGDDGPDWDHQFIRHPDGLVLAIIVSPPCWGDRIHAVRKDYSDSESKLSVRDGDVLVRVPGKTRPATSHDLSQLESRRAKSPYNGAKLDVSFCGGFDRVSRASVTELIDGMVRTVASELVASIPAPSPPGGYASGLQGFMQQRTALADSRSPNEFRAEVQGWVVSCQRNLPEVAEEFLRHELSPGTFVLQNTSDRYLDSVRVRVNLPAGLTVLATSDTDYCDHGGAFDPFRVLPDRPARFGQMQQFKLPNLSVARARQAGLDPWATAIDVERTDEGCVVAWSVGDLPPRGRMETGEGFVVFADEDHHAHNEHAIADDHQPMLSSFRCSWEVTARGVDYVFGGDLVVHCRQEPGAMLRWAPRE